MYVRVLTETLPVVSTVHSSLLSGEVRAVPENNGKRTLRRPLSQIINTDDNMPSAKHQKLAVGTL